MAVVLDFDGVIADNSKEYVGIALKAYSMLGRKVENPAAMGKKLRISRPYLRAAEDFYSILRLLEENKKVTFKAIDTANKRFAAERKEFGMHYFQIRKELMNNKGKWFGLYKKFTWLIRPLLKLSETHELFIATSRDRDSAYYITSRMGIPVKKTSVMSKEISLDKIKQMKFVCKKSGCAPEDILFIDDSIEQLKHVRKIGVKVALASWGFVLPAHIKEAERLGIPVLNRSNFSTRISELM